MTDINKIRDFMENKKDYGKEPLDEPLTVEQKKVAALSMGMNAAVIQFILEGHLKQEEQLHFMMHVQDFTARLYSGEEINFDGVTQTLSLNSVAGKLYAEAGEEALLHGHENFNKIKELANIARAKDAETNNLEAEEGAQNVPVDKPRTLH